MRLPGLKTLQQSGRWLASRWTGGALILGYHRIVDAACDPYGLCVGIDHFRQQLEVVRRYAQPMRLQELAHTLRDGRLPRRAVVLTFDDGYADTLVHAKPLLEAYEIPATVFVTTGALGREFWWDELARELLSAPALPGQPPEAFRVPGHVWPKNGSKRRLGAGGARHQRQSLLIWLYDHLLAQTPEERQTTLRTVRAWMARPQMAESWGRAASGDELIGLAAGGLVDIGAHSVTHSNLNALPAGVQRSEITDSKSCLEELLGQPVKTFAYPNGSVTEVAKEILREVGFDCACASAGGVAWTGSDRYSLPRFWIPNWAGATFGRWLQRWLMA